MGSSSSISIYWTEGLGAALCAGFILFTWVMFAIERVNRKRERGQPKQNQKQSRQWGTSVRQRASSVNAALNDALGADTQPVPTVPLPVVVPMPDGAPLGGIVTFIAPRVPPLGQDRPTLGGMCPDPDLPDGIPDLPDFPDIADEVREEPAAEDAPTQQTQRMPVIHRVIASNLGPLIVLRVADPAMLSREYWN